MSTFGGALGNASFQEPSSPDQTSAPAEQVPNQQQPYVSPLAQALKAAAHKKKQKTPAALAAAVARSKSAKPSSRKFG